MIPNYKTMARLFHADRSKDSFSNHKALAWQRLHADSTFRTGIVTPLGELFIATPTAMSALIERILLAERKISRLWGAIPGVLQWNYIYHFISEELLATNEMEGVRSTRKETEAAVAAAAKAAKEHHGESDARFREFARLYLNLTDNGAELPKTLVDIRSIYDNVALDEVADEDRPDGQLFRKGEVEIQGPHGTPIHSGVSGENAISILLTEMIALTQSDTLPSLQSAIASHFLFEYIHPFYDGNGRTGRYLLALYLNHNLTLPTVLSLSRVIAENKNTYYKAFIEAEDKLNCGELTFFVSTILHFISQAQSELIDQLGVKVDQLEKAEALCATLAEEHRLSERAHDLLYAVMQEELFDTLKTMTLEDFSKQIHASKQTVRKYVSELERTGLIEFAGRKPLRIRASQSLRLRIDGANPAAAGHHNAYII
jgi:Fic family protein